MMRFLSCFVSCLAFSSSIHAQKLPPPDEENPPVVVVPAQLELRKTNGDNWPKLEINNSQTNIAYTVLTSSNLVNWSSSFTVLGSPVWTNSILPVTIPTAAPFEFYRISSQALAPAHDNKNNIFAPIDPFLSAAPDFGKADVRWIKFAIAKDEPRRIYFQDSSKYLFHYDFATARLAQFKGMSHEAFDAVSLRTNNQQVILGTVLIPSLGEVREAGIQFTGLDAYSREQVRDWFDLVRAAIVSEENVEVFYIPAFEQSQVAQANAQWFESEGIKIASSGRWLTGNNFYSTGWAMGRLVFIPADQIATAYADGRLKASDILITDGVPAEVPYVSGIISLVPATPNSHVAILARSYGIPFIYLSDPALQDKARTLFGKEVIFSAFTSWFGNDLTLVEAAGLDAATRAAILAMKAAPPIQFVPKEPYGSLTAPTETMTPEDIKYFGGKSSNFGFLRRALPTNSYISIGISFDLWDQFLGQTMASGKTLREEIEARLQPHSESPNIQTLRTDLAVIRKMIEDNTRFTTEQTNIIKAALLAKFNPQQNIRFRSSTNLEDSETFTGAGLYDSYSGCLADDTDNDNAGPSICDPTETKERGVFRAIRKVFASFYNENAVLERLRHGVDENKVGMAMLVHHSSPDQFEAANGVATVQYNVFGDSISMQGDIVSQAGAISVTNPDGTALPELIRGQQFFGSAFFELQQRSSIVQYGAYVMSFESDYKQFMNYFLEVGKLFQAYHRDQSFTLDFEFKKDTSGNLVVKQVREIPQPDQQERVTPILLSGEAELQLFQGEYGDVFANHRLKVELGLESKSLQLAKSNLVEPFWVNGSLKGFDGITPYSLTGSPSNWPSATHTVADQGDSVEVQDTWTMQTASGTRKFKLMTQFPLSLAKTENPFVLPSKLTPYIEVTYSTPVYGLDYEKNEVMITNETARLQTKAVHQDSDLLIKRTSPTGAPVAIETEFYWPKPPTNPGPYTAPLIEFVGTKISGLTSTPIQLTGYYSQTYRPGHHNFVEDFVFEPRLDPGVSAATLAELQAKDIERIYFYWGGMDDVSQIYVSGANGRWRVLK